MPAPLLKTHLLSKDEFLACFSEPMEDVTASAEEAVDIWPYVDLIYLASEGITDIEEVAQVYRDAEGRYDQILLTTNKEETLVVVVVDRKAKAVFGHHVLDLGAEYLEE